MDTSTATPAPTAAQIEGAATAAPVAIISGAGGALGGAVATRFEAAGWRLALVDRGSHSARLRATHPQALLLVADLTDEARVSSEVGRAHAHFGRIDAVLNIAGGFAMQPATEADQAAFIAMLERNLFSAATLTRAALPPMLEQGSGFVLGVAARPAIFGAAKMPAYAASKAALVGYLNSLRAEVEGAGVGVSVLYPMGAIDTPANRQAMPNTDPARFIALEALADAALFLASRPARARVPELRVHPAG